MIQTLSSPAESISSLQAFCASMSSRFHLLCRVGGGIESIKDEKPEPTRHHRWLTAADDAEILSYRKRGMNKAWIGRKLGFDETTVANRLKRMGCK